MYGSYKSTSDSSSDNNPFYFNSFLVDPTLSMETSSTKHSELEDFKTRYTCDQRVASFMRHLNLSRTSDEGDVIMESFSEVERTNMIAPTGSPRTFF